VDRPANKTKSAEPETKTQSESSAESKTKTLGAPESSEKKPTKPPRSGLAGKIDAALASAAKFLASHQSPDGAWRSETYGTHKDGPSLTPLVAESLDGVEDDRAAAARTKAAAYLAAMAHDDGKIDPGSAGWTYPVYTSAKTVAVLSRREFSQHAKARDAWVKFLRRHQFSTALGWKPEDVFFGGWGYADEPPAKPPAGQMLAKLFEPNISATVFALEGLHAAGVGASDPTMQNALIFVRRCQNFRETARDLKVDDGGFFFIQDDPDRNKAGLAPPTDKGAEKTARRFRSYGTATADGLRCLLAAGLPKDDPRVVAARDWLSARFSAKQAPGVFDEAHEHLRKALYFYYCNSAARAFAACGVREVGPEKEHVSWAEKLSEELLKQQQPDGSWKNDMGEMREDDPLIATTLAIGALTHCRSTLFGERGASAP
jgi:Prenyltransferase and squalene oxidase repeat